MERIYSTDASLDDRLLPANDPLEIKYQTLKVSTQNIFL